MIVDMAQIGGSNVLAGALNGKGALSRLLETVAREPNAAEVCFLDFKNVDVATASYLREGVVQFRNMIRDRDSHYYPVFANLSDAVRDELLELARAWGDVFIACELAADGGVSRVHLLGELEAKQRLTFDLVKQHGETDAGELMREYGERENTRHATAWNNRLSALTALGLVIEMRQGRLKRYRPVFEGVE
jgi:DNA-binding transcriptional ArsR family regulator